MENEVYKKPKNSRNYSYIRVSTKEQNPDRQIDSLKSLNVDIDERDIYIDYMSGKTLDRPYYQALKRSIRTGDTLYIKSLDRFSRSKKDMKSEWQWFIERDIDIVVLDTPLLSTTNYKQMGKGVGQFISDLILEILSWLAEEEVRMINERTNQGIQSARDRGVVFGRPKKSIDDKFTSLYDKWKKGEIFAVEAIKQSDMSKATFYRRVKEHEESLGIQKSSYKDNPQIEILLKSLGRENMTEEEISNIVNNIRKNL
jgi:DNA invertase Pin-like site-specific DNA recombinase